MPVFDTLAELGEEAGHALVPRETLRALTPVEPALGATGKDDPEPEAARTVADAVERVTRRVPRWLLWIAGALAAVFSWSPSWSGPGTLARRLVGGTVVTGGPGTLARAVQAELPPFGRGAYLAVTDRRLLILEAAPIFGKRSISDGPAGWTAPRDVVARARRVPRLFARARYELVFTDSSRIVLSQGPFHSGGWHAARVVEALT